MREGQFAPRVYKFSNSWMDDRAHPANQFGHCVNHQSPECSNSGWI